VISPVLPLQLLAGTLLAPLITGLNKPTLGGHNMSTMPKSDFEEGRVAKAIEEQTAKLPSDAFLWGAVGCIAGAFALHFILGRKEDGVYVGLWVPTLLILGTYNKLVKQRGHDITERQRSSAF
jgi:hypothetical protein